MIIRRGHGDQRRVSQRREFHEADAIRMDGQNNLPGKGASSRFGAGGQAFAGSASGQQGLGHGSGGGGGAVAASSSGQSGGDGSDGYIEIWEYA